MGRMSEKPLRNRWEIQADIIDTCPAIVTRIMTNASVGWRPLVGILGHLIEKGYLIRQIGKSVSITSHSMVTIYYSTQRGREYVALVRRVAEAS